MQKFLLLLLCVFAYLKMSSSFSVNVPPVRSVCKTMIPGHDKYKPQEGIPPFSVTTDVIKVNGGEFVEVTLSAKDGKMFKGFYIQARDKTDAPVGTFNESAIVKTHDCGGIKSNGAHHTSADLKEKVVVLWKAPEAYMGPIKIRATAVEQFTTFWTPMLANEVAVM